MYVSPDTNNLRQGDIIRDVIFPLYNLNNMWTISDLRSQETPRIQMQYTKTYAMVISQCCEFQEGKRKHFLVALIGTIPDVIKNNSENYERLKASNVLPEDPHRKSYVDLFYLEPHMNFSEAIVRLNRVTSIHMNNKQQILQNKILQLSDEARNLLKEKLGYFFMRPV